MALVEWVSPDTYRASKWVYWQGRYRLGHSRTYHRDRGLELALRDTYHLSKSAYCLDRYMHDHSILCHHDMLEDQ